MSEKETMPTPPMDARLFAEHVHTERELSRLAVRIVRMAEASGLSRRVIAQRMGMQSPSTVQRALSGANVTVETLMRFATACGYRLKVEFEPMSGRPANLDIGGYLDAARTRKAGGWVSSRVGDCPDTDLAAA